MVNSFEPTKVARITEVFAYLADMDLAFKGLPWHKYKLFRLVQNKLF